jgi:hypothetical protein
MPMTTVAAKHIRLSPVTLNKSVSLVWDLSFILNSKLIALFSYNWRTTTSSAVKNIEMIDSDIAALLRREYPTVSASEF